MSEKEKALKSDLAKVDAYENTAEDYEELPELDDDFFDRATFEIGGVPAGNYKKPSPSAACSPGSSEHPSRSYSSKTVSQTE